MTLSEWLECSDPRRLVDYLWGQDVWHPTLVEQGLRRWVEACRRRETQLNPAVRYTHPNYDLNNPHIFERAVSSWAEHFGDGDPVPDEYRCYLLRDIFPYPGLRPITDCLLVGTHCQRHGCQAIPVRSTAWMCPAGRGYLGSVVKPAVSLMARDIYQKMTFEDLPILADAMEDSGCMAQSVLDHLRSPGPHVRGCWALEMLFEEGNHQ